MQRLYEGTNKDDVFTTFISSHTPFKGQLVTQGRSVSEFVVFKVL